MLCRVRLSTMDFFEFDCLERLALWLGGPNRCVGMTKFLTPCGPRKCNVGYGVCRI